MKYNEFELGVLFERLGLEDCVIDLVLESRNNIRGVLEGLLERHLRYTGVRVKEDYATKEIAKDELSPAEYPPSEHTMDDYYKAMEVKEDKAIKDIDVKPLDEIGALEEVESTMSASLQKTPLNDRIKSADPDTFIIKAGDNFMETTKKVSPTLYNDVFGDADTTVTSAVEEHSKAIDAEIEQLEKEEEHHVSIGDAWVPNNTISNDSPYNVVSDPFAPVGEKPAPSLWTTVGTPNQGSEKEIKKEEIKKVGKSTADPDWMTTEW